MSRADYSHAARQRHKRRSDDVSETKRIKRRTKIGAPAVVLSVQSPSKVAVHVDELGTVMITLDAADIDTTPRDGEDMSTRPHNATAADD